MLVSYIASLIFYKVFIYNQIILLFLYIDNQLTRHITHNHNFLKRMKHIDIDYHVVPTQSLPSSPYMLELITRTCFH